MAIYGPLHGPPYGPPHGPLLWTPSDLDNILTGYLPCFIIPHTHTRPDTHRNSQSNSQRDTLTKQIIIQPPHRGTLKRPTQVSSLQPGLQALTSTHTHTHIHKWTHAVKLRQRHIQTQHRVSLNPSLNHHTVTHPQISRQTHRTLTGQIRECFRI